MTKKARIFIMLLVCCIFSNILCIPASATETTENLQSIVYYEDGSYLVTTITYDTQPETSARGLTSQKSGKKEYAYRNGSNQLLWTFRVHGTFTYDGHSAEATFEDYSYDIYDSAWSFSRANASYSGATATANGSFSYRFIPNSVSISLTCSPKGVLS